MLPGWLQEYKKVFKKLAEQLILLNTLKKEYKKKLIRENYDALTVEYRE